MRIWKKRVIKTPFFTNDISRPSRGRFLKFWMFWKADAFLRKMCMSDCCYNEFRVPHDWQMIVALPKLMILRDCHVGTVVLWCGNDQTKLTTLSNQTAEGGTTQSWLQARGSPLEGLPSIWNPANALTFQIEDNSSWFSYFKEIRALNSLSEDSADHPRCSFRRSCLSTWHTHNQNPKRWEIALVGHCLFWWSLCRRLVEM